MTRPLRVNRERMPSLDVLYRDYAPRVYRLSRRILGNAADAEDVLQDVFLQVRQKLSTYRGESALGTWLYRLAVNTALAYRRRRAVRDRHRIQGEAADGLLEKGALHQVTPRLPSDPAQETLDHEQQHLVDEAVARLPHDQNDAVVLAELEERSLQEVAALLGLSVAAVKGRLHRARAQLRKKFAQVEETTST